MKVINVFLWVAATIVSLNIGAQQPVHAPPSAQKKAPPKKANALLTATHGNNAQGYVAFTETPEGVMIEGDFDFLEPGSHALHIHEYGDCSSPDGTSTGANYNPMGSRHGGPDFAIRHIGDLGNVVADDEGHAHYERVDRMIKLDGPHSIIGRSIAVHSNADDFTTQPAGNAGGRVACGRIE